MIKSTIELHVNCNGTSIRSLKAGLLLLRAWQVGKARQSSAQPNPNDDLGRSLLWHVDWHRVTLKYLAALAVQNT